MTESQTMYSRERVMVIDEAVPMVVDRRQVYAINHTRHRRVYAAAPTSACVRGGVYVCVENPPLSILSPARVCPGMPAADDIIISRSIIPPGTTTQRPQVAHSPVEYVSRIGIGGG